jgi:signal transduction histidine kinase/DNA-binding response OmpR family regulator
MKIPVVQVALRTDKDLIVARQRTKEIAALAGLPLQDATRLITAVSELARNAVQYAAGGKLKLSIIDGGAEDSRQYIEAIVTDNGPGISPHQLKSILNDSYVSKTGMGKGLAGSRRIVDKFSIESSSDGTIVAVSKAIPSTQAAVNGITVSGWVRQFGKFSEVDPIAQLQDQNRQLIDTLEELQLYRTQLEEQLETVRALNRELDLKSQQLLEASQHKGDFLANMSHEIRTPLNALLGINNILARTPLNSEQKHLLSLSKEAGRSLLALVNDVLDLSKIEAGKLRLVPENFDPHATITNIVAMLGTQAQEKGIALIAQLDESLPKVVVGDANRFRQVLVNLIGNAVKFTSTGEVRVNARVIEKDKSNATIRLEVTDTGPGISAEDQERLFASFVQLDTSVKRKHGGTGLGLSISRHIVELMGGKIGVESAIGAGSTFWFELMLSIPQAQASASSESTGFARSAEERLNQNKRVLLAEDHPINQLVATMELESLGLTVDLAKNGREAVECALRTDYALIFMDCQMPEMDGYEAAHTIRQRVARYVPIIAMTANAMAEDRERCLRAGMDDYMSKPFETADLEAIVEVWLDQQAKASDHSKAASQPTGSAQSNSETSFSDKKLRQRFNSGQIQLLLETLLNETPITLEELRISLSANRFDQARAIAHGLKGAFSLVFAAPLFEVASQLEKSCVSKDPELSKENLLALEKQWASAKVEAQQIIAIRSS